MASYIVQAAAKGTVLPFVLKPQDSVIVRWVSGFWTCNPAVPPAQYDANGNPNYTAKAGYLYPGALEGRLIACVGSPAVKAFPVGNYGVVHGFAGQLWVACNDDWSGTYGAGYGDNRGAISVEVLYTRDLLSRLRSDKEIADLITGLESQAAHEALASTSVSVNGLLDRFATIKPVDIPRKPPVPEVPEAEPVKE